MDTTKVRFIDIADDIEGRVPTSIVDKKREEEERAKAEQEAISLAVQQFIEKLKEKPPAPVMEWEEVSMNSEGIIKYNYIYKPAYNLETINLTFQIPVDEDKQI